MSVRLSLAAEASAVRDGADQHCLVIHPGLDLDLSVFGDADVTVVQDRMPDAARWQARGVEVVQDIPEVPFDMALVHLPRAKAAAKDWIARASQVAAVVLVDGQKTDGIESLLKDVRKRAEVLGSVSKAHGKLFWFATGADFSDWHAKPQTLEGRWHVRPGVFSADGIDPGSALLAEALPASLSGHIADLGAGWGYLAGIALERCAKISELHLVEAQGSALDCARSNVTDTRAMFHWADATDWLGAKGLDHVIMNPPFHTGRDTDPGLGRAFITSAARLLRKGGGLWMVANRHLPYEQELRQHFSDVTEIGGDNRYKLVKAIAKGPQRR